MYSVHLIALINFIDNLKDNLVETIHSFDKMKTAFFLFSVLLTCVALDSKATELYVGADVVPLNLWNECTILIDCSHKTNSGSSGHSYGTGIRVGVWLPHEGNYKTGLEIGYDKLGSISGSQEYNTNPCFILCTIATANWRHEATMKHVDLIGFLQGFASIAHNKDALLGKIGIYNSSIKSEGNLGLAGSSYSRVVSGTGLLLGLGAIHPITNHLSFRLTADFFFNVKVANPINPGGTLSDLLFKIALGVDYAF